jgi:hypothetical protein
MDSKPATARRGTGRLAGWILFAASLLLLSFGATPYHKIADITLITIRFSLVLVFSVLVLREWWNHRDDLPGGRGRAGDAGESALQRARRWYYGEESDKEQVSDRRLD